MAIYFAGVFFFILFFSPLGKLAGRAIYFTDVFSLFLFIFFYFFNGRLSSQRS